ncbi:MAG: hypothetical protein ACR2QM_18575, partial [Longimicrobiales bacterium]
LRDPLLGADNAPSALSVVAHYILRALTWLIVATAMLVWLIIGFVFWVPLLIRATVSFSAEVVNATLTGRSATAAGEMLKRAVGFYKSGFVVAVEAIGEPKARGDGSRFYDDDKEDGWGIDARGFLNELAWTALIWYLIASAVGWTTHTPFKLLGDFFAIEWAHHLGIIKYAFTSWISGLF